jgi:hypothetical protein
LDEDKSLKSSHLEVPAEPFQHILSNFISSAGARAEEIADSSFSRERLYLPCNFEEKGITMPKVQVSMKTASFSP